MQRHTESQLLAKEELYNFIEFTIKFTILKI